VARLDDGSPDPANPDETITPIAYRPIAARAQPEQPRRRVDRRVAAIASGAVVLALMLWFTLTAVSVQIVTEPEADDIDLPRTLLKLPLGDRVLLRPGEHRLRAELEGYHTLEATIDVGDESSQTRRFELRKLPGRLALTTTPAEHALVLVDGNEVGETPVEPIELEPGSHLLSIGAPRYVTFEAEILIEGGGAEQDLRVDLVPAWAVVSISSTPAGATIRVDERETGTTPASFDVLRGEHEVELELAGHKTWRAELVVVANTPMELPQVQLELADGLLQLRSEPAGAQVTLGSEAAGRTPVDLELASGETHVVTLFKPGYELASRRVTLASGEEQALTIRLAARYGTIELDVSPPDAEVRIGGRSVDARKRQRLVALPQRIRVARAGYVTRNLTVTPRPGFSQRIRIELLTVEQDAKASNPRVTRAPDGQQLVLADTGSFVMGSPRGEPGRRPNETPRPVELTRAFYVGVNEVTNAEFHKFRPEHRSLPYQGKRLDGDSLPVTSVDWNDAARYCNWLSAREGRTAVYVERGGRLVARPPLGAGYRLATEAEWAWIARFAGGHGAFRYPWGDELPPVPGSGNYADASASKLLSRTMSAYRDGFEVAAPVGRAKANPLGLYDLGGNVAEWVQDYYTIYPAHSGTPARDPIGPADGEYRVIRGSSWKGWSVTQLRLAYRDYASEGRVDVGFRIARYAD